jgi:hypothetical protein
VHFLGNLNVYMVLHPRAPGSFAVFVGFFLLLSLVTPCALVEQRRLPPPESHLIKFGPSGDGDQALGSVMFEKMQPFFRRCSFMGVLYTIRPLLMSSYVPYISLFTSFLFFPPYPSLF